MSYCVVLTQDGWRLALLVGRRKDVEPGTFRSVREACREAARLNTALEAVERPVTPAMVAA